MTTSPANEKKAAIEPKQGKENQGVGGGGGGGGTTSDEEKLCFECKGSLAESPLLIDIAGQKHKWHPQCFKCNICHEPMDKNVSCHIYKDKILCRNDYIQLQRDSLVECARCRWPVGPADWVRRAGKYVYHIACFNCDVCSRQLNTGEQFTIRQEEQSSAVRLLCRLHFTIEKQDNQSNHHGRTKPGSTSTLSAADAHSIGCDEETLRNRQIQSMVLQSRFRSSPISAQDSERHHQQQSLDPYDRQQSHQSTKAIHRTSRSSSNLCLPGTSDDVGDNKSSTNLSQQQLANQSAYHVSPSSSASLSAPKSPQSSSSSTTSSSALSSPNGSSSLAGAHNMHGCSNLSQSKSKRVRTTFTEDQLAILQNHFQIDSNPDGQDLERIATITGLSKRVTQVWFQNSRARQKKYMIKRKPGPNSMTTNMIATAASITSAPSTNSTITTNSDNLRNEFDFGQICSAANGESGIEVGNDIVPYSLTSWSNRNKNDTNNNNNDSSANLKSSSAMRDMIADDNDSRLDTTNKQLFVVDETTNDDDEDADIED